MGRQIFGTFQPTIKEHVITGVALIPRTSRNENHYTKGEIARGDGLTVPVNWEHRKSEEFGGKTIGMATFKYDPVLEQLRYTADITDQRAIERVKSTPRLFVSIEAATTENRKICNSIPGDCFNMPSGLRFEGLALTERPGVPETTVNAVAESLIIKESHEPVLEMEGDSKEDDDEKRKKDMTEAVVRALREMAGGHGDDGEDDKDEKHDREEALVEAVARAIIEMDHKDDEKDEKDDKSEAFVQRVAARVAEMDHKDDEKDDEDDKMESLVRRVISEMDDDTRKRAALSNPDVAAKYKEIQDYDSKHGKGAYLNNLVSRLKSNKMESLVRRVISEMKKPPNPTWTGGALSKKDDRMSKDQISAAIGAVTNALATGTASMIGGRLQGELRDQIRWHATKGRDLVGGDKIEAIVEAVLKEMGNGGDGKSDGEDGERKADGDGVILKKKLGYTKVESLVRAILKEMDHKDDEKDEKDEKEESFVREVAAIVAEAAPKGIKAGDHTFTGDDADDLARGMAYRPDELKKITPEMRDSIKKWIQHKLHKKGKDILGGYEHVIESAATLLYLMHEMSPIQAATLDPRRQVASDEKKKDMDRIATTHGFKVKSEAAPDDPTIDWPRAERDPELRRIEGEIERIEKGGTNPYRSSDPKIKALFRTRDDILNRYKKESMHDEKREKKHMKRNRYGSFSYESLAALKSARPDIFESVLKEAGVRETGHYGKPEMIRLAAAFESVIGAIDENTRAMLAGIKESSPASYTKLARSCGITQESVPDLTVREVRRMADKLNESGSALSDRHAGSMRD